MDARRRASTSYRRSLPLLFGDLAEMGDPPSGQRVVELS
jgi:hypothetical protein